MKGRDLNKDYMKNDVDPEDAIGGKFPNGGDLKQFLCNFSLGSNTIRPIICAIL